MTRPSWRRRSRLPSPERSALGLPSWSCPGTNWPRSWTRNPYPDEPNPKLVHVVFLNAELPPDLLDRIKAAESAAAAKGSRDTVTAIGPALYLHTPDGFGTSELAQVLFRIIGTPVRGTAPPQAQAGAPGKTASRPRPGTGPRPPSCCPCARTDSDRPGDRQSRAVLVTGASRGIGRAVAQAFARQGDRVAVHHRDSAALAQEVLAGLPGDGHTVVRADLADAGAVRQMVDQAAAEPGRAGRPGQQRRDLRVAPDHRGVLRAVAGRMARDPGRQPHRGRQRDLVRGSAHEGSRRPDRQRDLARRLPRRAPAPGLRGQQGGPERVRAVDGPRARAVRHLGRHGGARDTSKPRWRRPT